MTEELCEICGEYTPLTGTVCGRCYLVNRYKQDQKELEAAEQIAQEQLDIMAKVAEKTVEAMLQASMKNVVRNHQSVETTVEKDGETYGITFGVKRLNEAEKEAWENAKKGADTY